MPIKGHIPGSFLVFPIVLEGGVLDGHEHTLPDDLSEVTMPCGEFAQMEVHPLQAKQNMEHHGHPFPMGAEFHKYVFSGHFNSQGKRIYQYVGVTNQLGGTEYE